MLLLLQRKAAVIYDGLTYDRCRLVQVTVGGCDGGQGLETGVAIVDDAVVQLCITVLPEKQTMVYRHRTRVSFSPHARNMGRGLMNHLSPLGFFDGGGGGGYYL